MTIRVRDAELGDVAWIVGELRKFDEFFPAKASLFPKDEGQARRFVETLVENHVVLVAASCSDVPVGFIAGTLGPHPYNPELTCLSELFWWVTEEHRGSRAGALLFHEFMAVGHEHAHWIRVGLEVCSPVNPDALEKRGFVLIEREYLLEVAV